MGEGEKEQGHTSKLGGGGRTKPQTCGDPWGRRAGGSFRDELGPRSLPSAPPAQPRGSRNQRRISFLAVFACERVSFAGQPSHPTALPGGLLSRHPQRSSPSPLGGPGI